MSLSNRAYTYHGRIKISRADMELLRQGRKRCTIRLGIVSVATPEILMTDGRVNVLVRILKVDCARCLGDLTDQDAQDEGFRTREELLQDLKKYYPQAKSNDPITVIYFEALGPGQSSLWTPDRRDPHGKPGDF